MPATTTVLRNRRALAHAILGVLVASCEGSTDPPQEHTPARLEIVSGDAQRDTVGQELPHSLAVRLVDARGSPIPGRAITFRVTAGQGTLVPESSLTNAQGLAQQRWTLGTSIADSQRVEARVADTPPGQTTLVAVFRATPLAGPPASLAVHMGQSQQGPAFARLSDSIRVKLADGHGNPVAGEEVTWEVLAGGGAILPPRSHTDSSGVASASWTLGGTVGPQSIRASVSGVPPVTIPATGTPPVLIPMDVLSISAGGGHTCAVARGGRGYCWGRNTSGQLGDGTTEDSPWPRPIAGGLAFESVTAGEDHSCGLTTDGVSYCWGSNEYGQLGNGTTASSTAPVQVSGGGELYALSAGGKLTCALDIVNNVHGVARCWGHGRTMPTPIGPNFGDAVSGFRFYKVSSGFGHACGIRDTHPNYTDHQWVWCWGDGYEGQTPDGMGLSGMQQAPVYRSLDVSAGYGMTCSVAIDYPWMMWCHNATYGGFPIHQRYAALSLGGDFVCAITGNFGFGLDPNLVHVVVCFGANARGQLGTGVTGGPGGPIQGALTGFAAVDAGRQHACAIRMLTGASPGEAYCWGDNGFGQLGTGASGPDSMSPAPIRVTLPHSQE